MDFPPDTCMPISIHFWKRQARHIQRTSEKVTVTLSSELTCKDRAAVLMAARVATAECNGSTEEGRASSTSENSEVSVGGGGAADPTIALRHRHLALVRRRRGVGAYRWHFTVNPKSERRIIRTSSLRIFALTVACTRQEEGREMKVERDRGDIQRHSPCGHRNTARVQSHLATWRMRLVRERRGVVLDCS